jgi:hypothetical protein
MINAIQGEGNHIFKKDLLLICDFLFDHAIRATPALLHYKDSAISTVQHWPQAIKNETVFFRRDGSYLKRDCHSFLRVNHAYQLNRLVFHLQGKRRSFDRFCDTADAIDFSMTQSITK